MQRKSILTQEEELTLLIVSETPEAVVEDVARLTRMDGFSLIARETRIIRDVYYDRSDGLLSRKGWVLRIRDVNSELLVTLKGPPTRAEWGGVQRLEFEAPWSRESFESTINFLAMSGISLQEEGREPDLSDPYGTVESMGFRAIQDRETIRRVREIVVADDDSSGPIGELVIDSVTYHFPGMNVGHFELELEAGTTNTANLIGNLARFLLESFGSVLRPWNMGKTATGKRVERLLAEGMLSDFLKDGKLLPVAYDHMLRR